MYIVVQAHFDVYDGEYEICNDSSLKIDSLTITVSRCDSNLTEIYNEKIIERQPVEEALENISDIREETIITVVQSIIDSS